MSNGEICILAGGLSERMGRNKARVRLDGKTLLRHVFGTAQRTPWPIRIIRRDIVPRCGPLGGIFSSFKTTQATQLLFLACDMPFVTVELLEQLMSSPVKAAFARSDTKAGFPFALSRDVLPAVEEQLGRQEYSLQKLARHCGATLLPVDSQLLLNVNTPEDLRRAANLLCHCWKND